MARTLIKIGLLLWAILGLFGICAKEPLLFLAPLYALHPAGMSFGDKLSADLSDIPAIILTAIFLATGIYAFVRRSTLAAFSFLFLLAASSLIFCGSIAWAFTHID